MSVRKHVDRVGAESHEHWKDLGADERAKLIELIEGGSEIEAVKYFRAVTGLGLADSKAAIDAATLGTDSRSSAGAPRPIPLSTATVRRLRFVFGPELHDEATTILQEIGGDTPEGLERLRFAALKVSQGSLGGLRSAVQMFRTDWRDLLMMAGFGHDVNAYERWLEDDLSEGKRWWEFWK